MYTEYTTKCYSGKKLLEKYPLTKKGIWKIYGEDPSCDFGGSHVRPDLGLIEGQLEDVIKYAIKLPRFWQWGAGGDIEFVGEFIPSVDLKTEQKRKLEKLKEQKQSIQNEINELETSLKS